MTTVQNPFNNPEFRKELTELLDDKLSPIVTKVADHETSIQRARGFGVAFVAIWSVITGIGEWLLHRKP